MRTNGSVAQISQYET